MIGRESIPRSQIGASFSNSADQDSIAGMQVYSFTHQIASRCSIPSGRISEHLSDSGDQVSVPSQQDFSWPQQTSNVNSIHSESINFFSKEQNLMFRQQIPPFIQQISDKSSSSGLSQDTITI
jgi:hypothetical protein